MDEGDARLKASDAERRETGNCEVNRSREQIHFDQPPVALRDLAGSAQKIGDRQHVDQRSVLEQHDGLRQQHREHVPERLWQHHVTHGLAQAFRNMPPVLLTQTIVLFQDTSLVYVLSIPDFLGAASKVAQRDGRLVEMYLFAAAVYFIISSAASFSVRRLQARISIVR